MMESPRAKILRAERMKHAATAEVQKQRLHPVADPIPRPYIRRITVEGTASPTAVKRRVVAISALECPSANKRRLVNVTRENSSPDMKTKMLYISSSIMRESSFRKQTVSPLATKINHPQELKPILKSGGNSEFKHPQELKPILKSGGNSASKFKSPNANSTERSDGESVSSSGSDKSSADVKCCYRLPERPPTKLRKSVSFCEDQTASVRRIYTRHYSPIIANRRGNVFSMRKLNDSLIHL